MRRAWQQVDDPATLEAWLAAAPVGRLATVDATGYPVVKPVNYVYAAGCVYFHSAPEGEKLDDIRRDDRVGFEVDRLFAVTPPPGSGCSTHCFYQSVIIRGRARILEAAEERPERDRALRGLVEKYAPSALSRPLDKDSPVVVVRIAVERLTGKEDFGQRWSAERKLAVARLLWERDGDAAREVIARMGVSLAEVGGGGPGRASAT